MTVRSGESVEPILDELFQSWMRAARTDDHAKADEAAREYFDELVITDLVGPGHLPLAPVSHPG